MKADRGNSFQDNYILKIILVVGIIVVLDLSIGFVLRKIYFLQNHGVDYRTTYVMEENRSDLLVLGASSGNHHYHYESFEKIDLSFYNGGCDGNFIFYYYAMLRSTLNRYSPEIIILDIGEDDFYESPDSYDRISYLLPYYKTHPEIRDIVEMKSKWEKIKLISRIYPFNSKIISGITGWMDIYNKKDEEAEILGYVPLNNTWDKPPVAQMDDKPFDDTKIEIFNNIIQECNGAGVVLIIVASPSYREFSGKMRYIEMVDSIAHSNEVQFWDYSNDPFFASNPEYFFDYMHLNNEGAQLFSERIVNMLLSLDDESRGTDQDIL